MVILHGPCIFGCLPLRVCNLKNGLYFYFIKKKALIDFLVDKRGLGFSLLYKGNIILRIKEIRDTVCKEYADSGVFIG